MRKDGENIKKHNSDLDLMKKRAEALFCTSISEADDKVAGKILKKWFQQEVNLEREKIKDLWQEYKKYGLKAGFMKHVNDEKLKSYLNRELREDDVAEIEAHLYVCLECAKKLLEI